MFEITFVFSSLENKHFLCSRSWGTDSMCRERVKECLFLWVRAERGKEKEVGRKGGRDSVQQ